MILRFIKRCVEFTVKVILGTFFGGTSLALSFIVICLIIAGIYSAISSHKDLKNNSLDLMYGKEESPNTFVSIPINGVIVGDESDVGEPLGAFSQSMTFGYDIKKQLYELVDAPAVKGVILDINSPGGTIYGANAIADGVAYFKQKTHKPVYAFVSGLAASGAYWSAVSADTIIADVGTEVGSIGVISGPYQFYNTVLAEDGGLLSGGVVTEKGIETTYITAGKSKDFGNPYRRLTKEEIDSVQGMVNNEYDTFVSYVSSQRKIPKETIINTLGAMVYDGKSALTNHMIDSIGSRDEAYNLLAKKAGITDGNYGVYQEMTKRGFLTTLLESSFISHAFMPKVSLCNLTKLRLVYHGNVEEFCQ